MIEIENPSEFEVYLKTDKPVVPDFYTDSCNSCKSLMFILEKLNFNIKMKFFF